MKFIIIINFINNIHENVLGNVRKNVLANVLGNVLANVLGNVRENVLTNVPKNVCKNARKRSKERNEIGKSLRANRLCKAQFWRIWRSIRDCRRMFSQRIPKGKASVLIFLMVVIEQFVFYGAVSEVLELIPELNNLQGSELRYLLQPFLLFCVGRLFYPVGGYLADVYFGRYRVIHISLWLYWVAFVLLTIANTIYILNKGENIVHDYIIPLISYSCIILASGGFQSTIIPFGADQLEAASSSELSSYFYWYYLGIQISAPLNVIIFSLLTLYLPSKLGIAQSLISLVVVTVGLILHITLKNWYFRNALRENCIKIVTQVTCFAAIVRRQVPQYHRAFRYGEDKLPRIELAKREYDGKFTRDQVEDVKTFCRICLILFTFGGYLLSMNGVSYDKQFITIKFNKDSGYNDHQCNLSSMSRIK